MKKRFLAIGLVAQLLMSPSLFAFDWYPYQLKKGDWISKLLYQKEYFSQDVMDQTLEKNELDYQQAKKLQIGKTVYLPEFNFMNRTVANQPSDLTESEVDDTSSANTTQTEIAPNSSNTNRDLQFSVAVGLFNQTDNVQTQDIDRDINTMVTLGTQMTWEQWETTKLNGLASVSGKFYDETDFAGNETGVVLDPSFALNLGAQLINDELWAATAFVQSEMLNQYATASNLNISTRRDFNQWVGLRAQKTWEILTPYISGQYLAISSRASKSEGFDQLEGQIYTAGLEVALGKFDLGIYHDYYDWQNERNVRSRVYGSNLRYNF